MEGGGPERGTAVPAGMALLSGPKTLMTLTKKLGRELGGPGGSSRLLHRDLCSLISALKTWLSYLGS